MNHNLLILALSLMTWGVGEGMFMLFQPLYLQQLGADPVEIGGILGLTGIAMGIAHMPAGYLSDRFGRLPMLKVSWLLGLVATGVMAVAGKSLGLFIAGMTIYALTSFVSGPMNSYVTAARGKWSVGRALTFSSASFSAGAMFGPLIGGQLGLHLGLETIFRYAFGLFIISTIMIWFLAPQPVEPRRAATSAASAHPFTRRFALFLVVLAVSMFGMSLAQPLTQNFLQNQRGLDLGQIGILAALRGLGIVVFNLSIGRLPARTGFLIAQCGVALFALLVWQGSSMFWYGAAYLLLGNYFTARALAMAQGHTLVGIENMGLAYGVIETANASVAFLAPVLAGLLTARNPELVYPVAIAGIGASLLISWRFLPTREKTHHGNTESGVF